MATQIQLRRDTAANWTSNNPTLAIGETGFETDTFKIKIGDGSTVWTSLSYVGGYGDIPGTADMVFFNVNNDLAASANLIFQASTGTLTVNGNIVVTGPATGAALTVSDGYVVNTPYDEGTENVDSVTLDFEHGNHQFLTITYTGATFTFNNPLNDTAGIIGTIRIERGATWPSAAIAFGTDWEFPGGTVPDIHGDLTTSGDHGYVDFYVHSGTEIRANWSGKVS